LSLVFGSVAGGAVFLALKATGNLTTATARPVSSTGPTTTQNVTLEESSAIIDAAKAVNPAVVTIISVSQGVDYFGDITQQEGTGSGVIYDSSGYILTNKHVAADPTDPTMTNPAKDVTVILQDGTKYTGAKVIGLDPLTDLAVIKVDASNLPIAAVGDSSALEVGQRVLAIGNPLGTYSNTVTAGVISALGRTVTVSDQYGQLSEVVRDMIQTDAPINPGNSGGPMVNLLGQVVGINTAVAGQAQGIGFAIPINIAKPIMDQAIREGKITRPWLGVYYITINKQVKAEKNLPVAYGAYIYFGGRGRNVSPVVPGSPADKAGLREKDIIIKVDDQVLDEKHELGEVLPQYKVGDKVKLTFLRDSKEMTVEVTLAEMPKKVQS